MNEYNTFELARGAVCGDCGKALSDDELIRNCALNLEQDGNSFRCDLCDADWCEEEEDEDEWNEDEWNES